MSALGGLLAYGQMFATEMKVGRELRKQELLERWEKSKDMPRKKKKQERKDINLTWSIVSWNPLPFDLDDFSLF
jgi:hypothetical protein